VDLERKKKRKKNKKKKEVFKYKFTRTPNSITSDISEYED